MSEGASTQHSTDNGTGSRAAKSPTVAFYGELQRAFDHFNRALFNNQLPPCLITLRSSARVYGYSVIPPNPTRTTGSGRARCARWGCSPPTPGCPTARTPGSW